MDDLVLHTGLLRELCEWRIDGRQLTLRAALKWILTDEFARFQLARARCSTVPQRYNPDCAVPSAHLPRGMRIYFQDAMPLLHAGGQFDARHPARCAEAVLFSGTPRIWRVIQILRAATKFCEQSALLDGFVRPPERHEGHDGES